MTINLLFIIFTTDYNYICIILPNSTIIISLLVSVISVLVGFVTPSSNSIFSNPPTITSHTQCGDIVTAVSE